MSFPLTAKTVVKGQEKHPLFQKLIAASPQKGEVAWNFEKFLVNKTGQVIGRFRSRVKPEDAKLIQAIEKTL